MGWKLAALPVLLFATTCGDASAPTKLKLVADPTWNNQVACFGCVTAFPPAIRITDGDGNGYAGLGVQFAPGANSGTLSSDMATTDANGLAQAGDWQLDANASNQRVDVMLSGSSVVVAQVVATARNTCARTPHILGTSTSGVLNAQSFFDSYSLVNCYSFTITGGPVLMKLNLTEYTGPHFAAAQAYKNTQNSYSYIDSYMPVVASNGDYEIMVYGDKLVASWAYVMQTLLNPSLAGVCDVAVMRNVTVNHVLETQCLYSSPVPGEFTNSRAHKFYSIRECGTTPTIARMSSSAFAPRLEAYSSDGTLVAAANGTTSSPAVLNIGIPCYYTDGPPNASYVIATHTLAGPATPPSTGAFTFTIDP